MFKYLSMFFLLLSSNSYSAQAIIQSYIDYSLYHPRYTATYNMTLVTQINKVWWVQEDYSVEWHKRK